MSKQRDDYIFALDIGTRSVIGIVGYKDENQLLNVVCTDRENYSERVVVDGQIENISKTADTAAIVKKRMEQTLGFELKTVHIAAAGRALRTMESHAEMPITEQAVTDEFIDSLIFKAVEQAYQTLAEEGDHTFFCVGHAVKQYILDGYPISSLLDHKGELAAVSLIVTFLPREVVESLYTTMRHIGLTVSGLTLEPIAAMNAIVPTDLRKLNIALCDIGAGTSDIAVCNGGTVTAYTMATIAGDEITEAIMNACLCDFDMAESIKSQLSNPENTPVKYSNIMGMTFEQSASEILASIETTVNSLAEVICQRILEVNDGAPAAVFLVGGGSKTPKLAQLVSRGLDIDISRVAVGNNVYMKKMFTSEHDIWSPEYATPTGIAITAAERSHSDAFNVTINGKSIRLLNTWDTSVLGVLQMARYPYSQIIGRGGKQLFFTVNGNRKTVFGTPSQPAVVLKNGETASLSDTVLPGDIIEFTPTSNGIDATTTVSELMEKEKLGTITVDGALIDLPFKLTVNGASTSPKREIKNGDKVKINPLTLEKILEQNGFNSQDLCLFANGEQCTEQYRPKDGDVITLGYSEIDDEPEYDDVHEVQNHEPELEVPHEQPPQTAPAPVPEQVGFCITFNGRQLLLPPRNDGREYCFYDLFSYADIDTGNPKGDLLQTLNGKPATYLAVLSEGDVAILRWAD